MSGSLTRERALIFRITHLDNVPWIMANGMHCRNSTCVDPGFVSIGSPAIIEGRHERNVPCAPFGTLSEYIPFYFTSFSPMAYNINTGYRGIRQRPNEEIVIFVSSLPELVSKKVPFLFTDRHAYLRTAEFFTDLSALDRIDWLLFRQRNFGHDPEDPSKVERYQAEALVHRHLPMNAVKAVLCFNNAATRVVQQEASACGHTLQALSKPGWYF